MKTITIAMRQGAGLSLASFVFVLAGAAAAGPEPAEPVTPAAPVAPVAPPELPAPAISPVLPAAATKGSLATMAPLGKGRFGISIGGGVAVLLPLYAIEAGFGLGPRLDLVGRFESVVGVLHYPSIGVRFSPVDLGAWKLGFGAAVNYSFFGLKTDQVNLTSTFYLSAAAGISGPVTKSTDVMLDVSGELDLFDYESLDGESAVTGNVHYDATIFRMGMKTKLTEDLDGYLRARVRVPIETVIYEAMSFYVVPSIEVGGTFVF